MAYNPVTNTMHYFVRDAYISPYSGEWLICSKRVVTIAVPEVGLNELAKVKAALDRQGIETDDIKSMDGYFLLDSNENPVYFLDIN